MNAASDSTKRNGNYQTDEHTVSILNTDHQTHLPGKATLKDFISALSQQTSTPTAYDQKLRTNG